MNEPSTGLKLMFAALAVALAAAFVAGVLRAWRRTGASQEESRRAASFAFAGAAAWLAATGGAAASGRLHFDTMPPTMLLLVVAMIGLALWLGISRVGTRLAAGLPLAVLVGVQGFRLPLELMMHRAYSEGVMPVQMSYSGYNFDIVTGATAIIVALLVASGRGGARLVRLWNWLGVVLLVNILTIAILSAPLPIRVFMNEPPNVWVTRTPFVWLPAVMVLMAILGHVVVLRALRSTSAPLADTA